MRDEMTEQRPLVVCLHGSASSGNMWREFRKAVRDRARVVTPTLVGYGDQKFDAGKRHTLDHELKVVMEQIGDTTEPFHLVGHSYGGAVATLIAKRYPDRVASLILYEPGNYALLFKEGLHTAAAREMRALRLSVAGKIPSLLSRWLGARTFISFWSGSNAWRRLSFRARRRIASLIPKVIAEFDAMLAAKDELASLADLRMPVRILCGTRTRQPARRVAELMAEQLRDVRLLRLVDLEHMGPVTHPHLVNPIILDYILPVEMPGQKLAA